MRGSSRPIARCWSRTSARSRAAVAQSLDYHFSLDDTLRTFAGRNEPGVYPDGRVFSRGFIHPAAVLSTAWETATATDAISHMPYATVVRLNRMYEQQQSYESQAETVGQILYQQLFTMGYEHVLRNYRHLSTIVGTFWYRECQLLASYDEVLADADSTSAPAQPLPPECQYAMQGR